MQNEKIWNSTPETEDDHAKTLTPLSLQSTLASRVKILTEDNKKKKTDFFFAEVHEISHEMTTYCRKNKTKFSMR